MELLFTVVPNATALNPNVLTIAGSKITTDQDLLTYTCQLMYILFHLPSCVLVSFFYLWMEWQNLRLLENVAV